MHDYFRRDGILGILVTSLSDSISIQVSTISSIEGPTQKVTFAIFTAILQAPCRGEAVHRFYRAYSERTRSVLRWELTTDVLRTTITTMAKIQELHLTSGRVVGGFLQPDTDGRLANKQLLPSLRRLRLEDLCEDDWSPLLPFPPNFWRSEDFTRCSWGMPSYL